MVKKQGKDGEEWDPKLCQTQFGVLLKQRSYFVVLDDVWDSKVIRDLLPNTSLGKSRIMVTTRRHDLLGTDAAKIEVDLLDPDSSLAVLLRHAQLHAEVLGLDSRLVQRGRGRSRGAGTPKQHLSTTILLAPLEECNPDASNIVAAYVLLCET